MAKREYNKGINTRARVAEAEAPYVMLVVQLLRKKIQNDWLSKWEQQGLGESLLKCYETRRFAQFIRLLRADLLTTLRISIAQQGSAPLPKLQSLSDSALKRFIKEETSPTFLQEHTRLMLAVYIGYTSWDDFKEKHQEEVQKIFVESQAQPFSIEPDIPQTNEEVLPMLPAQYVYALQTEQEYMPIELLLQMIFFSNDNVEEADYKEVRRVSKKVIPILVASLVLIVLVAAAVRQMLPKDSKGETDAGMIRIEAPVPEILYEGEKADIYYQVGKTGDKEIYMYRRLPEVDTTLLDDCYAPNAPSRQRIIRSLLRRQKEGLTMGHPDCRSAYKILSFQFKVVTDSFAVVLTKEKWFLEFWDWKNQKKDDYRWDKTDWQMHYLSKKSNGRWLVDSVKRSDDGVYFVMDD